MMTALEAVDFAGLRIEQQRSSDQRVHLAAWRPGEVEPVWRCALEVGDNWWSPCPPRFHRAGDVLVVETSGIHARGDNEGEWRFRRLLADGQVAWTVAPTEEVLASLLWSGQLALLTRSWQPYPGEATVALLRYDPGTGTLIAQREVVLPADHPVRRRRAPARLEADAPGRPGLWLVCERAGTTMPLAG